SLLMRYLAIVAAALLLTGCTFSRGGSQALSVDPFKVGSDEPALSVANDGEYVDGMRWNAR
ncbi:MAG TPA: hypothetical protein VF175_00140, partial [Lacipirellula sp.]